MITEGEQQEAVCGACAGDPRDGDGYHAYNCPERTGRTPAPVVPSDDERCAVCGHHVEAHGISRYCYECPKDEDGTALHEFQPRVPAPPTPSQDAEGDGLARLFHEAYERLAPSFGYETRVESAVPWEQVPERNRALMVATCREVESAIREPYEALVKAARDARSALVLLTSELSGQIGYIEGLQQRPHGQPQRAIDHAHEVGARVSAALTNIEESYGG